MDLQTLTELKNTHEAAVEQLLLAHKDNEAFFAEYSYMRDEYGFDIGGKAEAAELKTAQERLSMALPPSYVEFVTTVGLTGFRNNAYKMLPPDQIATLSDVLETQWKVNWSREHPQLKANTDKIVVFALGNADQQDFYYVCFDYRDNIQSAERPLFYFCQDEIWDASHFAQQPSEVGKSTIDTFIMQGFEHALEEADELITCFLEEYE